MDHLLQHHPVVCIQEHWLYRFEADYIYNLFSQCHGCIKCVDDLDPIPNKLRPRGTAGVAIIWHKSHSHAITPLPDGGDRLQAIHISTSSNENIVVINTYMPTNGTMADADYNEVLDEVYEVVQKYSPNNKILWIGDINASTKRARPTANDRAFKAFCLENKLLVSPLRPDLPTYHHFHGEVTSQIDLAITVEEQQQFLHEVSIDVRSALNTSPHDAIVAHTDQSLAPAIPDNTKGKQSLSKKVNWKKADKDKYAETAGRKLEALMETTTASTPIEITRPSV